MDNQTIVYIVAGYIGLMWLITSIVTILDKYRAVRHKWRIPEKVLFILAFLGGATAEYAVMKMIRHKTQHKSFMIGLPLIIILHVSIIVAVELYIHGIFT